MKNNIDISVIIPAFNAADSIGILVHTLLGETTLSTEIIVVDDGSTDETWTVLSAITDERLILIRQENQGVYAARNAALAIHRGEWVVFLDADDRIAADFLQERLRTAREAQTDVVLFNARHTDSTGHLQHPVHRRQPYGQTLTGQQWIHHCVSQREWPHCRLAGNLNMQASFIGKCHSRKAASCIPLRWQCERCKRRYCGEKPCPICSRNP